MPDINNIIAEIKGQVNVLDLLERSGLNPKKIGRQYQCCCPFHEEKSPSFTINISKGFYKCFGCNWAGDVVNFVKDFRNVDTITACKELITMYSLNISLNEDKTGSETVSKATQKKPSKLPSKLPDPIPLPNLNLATFPDDYEVKPCIIRKDTTQVSSQKQQGIAYTQKTIYLYSENPKIYKIKREQFSSTGERIPFDVNGRQKDKLFTWYHDDEYGYPQTCIPENITIYPYKYNEALELGNDEIVVITEGEKDTELFRSLGIVAISLDNPKKDNLESLKNIDSTGFLIFADNDEAGVTKSGKVAEFLQKNKIPFALIPIASIWEDAPVDADISDYYGRFCYSYDDDPEDAYGSRVDLEFINHLTTKLNEMLFNLSNSNEEVTGFPVFKIGDYVAHEKYPQRKLQILEITDNYEDGDNGIISGYIVKGYGFDSTPYFIIESVLIPYIESNVDKEQRERDALELVVENTASKTEQPEVENLVNITQDKEVTIPKNIRGIIFNKIAREGLGKGKIVTRREWTAKTAQYYIDYYQQGVLIPALSGRLDRSGIEIGKLRLTKEPYQQPLSEMTQDDLVKEGFPDWTLEEFYYKFFDGDNAKNVWVLEFDFFPNNQKQKFDDLQDQYRELTVEQREEIYTEIALNELYSDSKYPYCAIADELHQWTGTHYEKCKEAFEKRRISRWLVNFSPKLALDDKVNQVLKWVVTNLPVDADDINPGGINLLNGVLKPIFDESGKCTVVLEPHSPDKIYNYCSPINYNPEIDDTNFKKMMGCLEPAEQKIFLRTIAMAFDLPYFRSKLGRPRALLLKGDGNNGKDTLNACLKQIFGIDGAFVEASLGDFKQYDQGRKFSLASLCGALISWSSENVDGINIEKMASLKAAISGEVIKCELKNQNEKPFLPKCLFIFNCNNPPKFPSKQEAVESRWAILQFNKTYKTNPNKRKGELKADPRFKDDIEFIREQLAPAMLNALIKELEDLAINGIDFSPIRANLEDLQEDSSHLFSFCKDIGLKEDVDLQIGVSELWELLQQWYQDNGILEIIQMEKGKDKRVWNDQVNPYDKNVTGSNQVFKRFKLLFPKIKLSKETVDANKKGRSIIKGIGFFGSPDSPLSTAMVSGSLLGSPSEAGGEAESLAISSSESGEAKVSIISDNLAKVKQLSFFEKKDFLDQILTQDDWEMLEAMFFLVGTLNHCASTHDLGSLTDLRKTFPKELLKMASLRLPLAIRQTIYNMIVELDKSEQKPIFQIGDRVCVDRYPMEIFIVKEISKNQVAITGGYISPNGQEWVSFSELKKAN